MNFGITLGYEKDTCSVCGELKEIRIIFMHSKGAIGKVAYVCDKCAESSNTTVQDLIKENGKPCSTKDIHIISKEKLLGEIEVKSKQELDKEKLHNN